jgi:hypothetical protein
MEDATSDPLDLVRIEADARATHSSWGPVVLRLLREMRAESFTFETDEERSRWFDMVERLGPTSATIGDALRHADSFILEVRRRDCRTSASAMSVELVDRIARYQRWSTDLATDDEPPEDIDQLLIDVLHTCGRKAYPLRTAGRAAPGRIVRKPPAGLNRPTRTPVEE